MPTQPAFAWTGVYAMVSVRRTMRPPGGFRFDRVAGSFERHRGVARCAAGDRGRGPRRVRDALRSHVRETIWRLPSYLVETKRCRRSAAGNLHDDLAQGRELRC